MVFLAALIFAFFSTKGITTNLISLKDMIEGLSESNLEKRLEMDRSDEMGDIAQAMDKFADDLQLEVLTAFQKLAEGDFTFEAQGLIKKPLTQLRQ